MCTVCRIKARTKKRQEEAAAKAKQLREEREAKKAAEEAAKAMEGRRGFGTWSEAYLDVLRQLQDNKTLVLNVYRSVGREQVEQYLYRLLVPILKDFADRECHDITEQDADKQFVVDFYKYALVGMTLEWTRRDMKGDPKKMVERVSTMIHGDFRRALCRLSSGSLKIEE